MIQFTGLVNCSDDKEIESVIAGLKRLPDVKIEQMGSRIEAYYMPEDDDPDTVIENTVKRIINVLEIVDTHGFSVIFGR